MNKFKPGDVVWRYTIGQTKCTCTFDKFVVQTEGQDSPSFMFPFIFYDLKADPDNGRTYRIAESALYASEEEARAAKLDPLKELFEAKDYDALKDKFREEDYVAFAEEVIGDNSYYSGDYDLDGRREGYGVAVYENGYYYYGQFHEDKRSGHGVLMRASYPESSSIGSFIYDGEWSDDKPNGEGTCKSNYFKDKISASDFATKEISGNYKDGLEDGTMTLTGIKRSGEKRVFKYTSKDGIAERSSKEDSGVKGQYIIAQNEDKSESLTSDGSKRGVEGFIDE